MKEAVNRKRQFLLIWLKTLLALRMQLRVPPRPLSFWPTGHPQGPVRIDTLLQSQTPGSEEEESPATRPPRTQWQSPPSRAREGPGLEGGRGWQERALVRGRQGQVLQRRCFKICFLHFHVPVSCSQECLGPQIFKWLSGLCISVWARGNKN